MNHSFLKNKQAADSAQKVQAGLCPSRITYLLQRDRSVASNMRETKVCTSKMAEPARVADEVNRVQEDSEEEQNETCIPSQLPNSEFTAELNLVIVFLSLFSSLPTEESLNFEECEQERNRDEAKAITKRLKTKRRETDEVKPIRRRAQRFQTRIRDVRHGRRM